MPKIRIERHPVKAFKLGALGFDHLHLVYQPDEAPGGETQDDWLLIEGLREPTWDGVRLSVEGWEGRTSLAEANGGATGEDLEAKIRTPAARGSRIIPLGGDEYNAWATMTSFAGDIEAQGFPYIAVSLPGSPLPTINSSSLVSSLLYYAGVDIMTVMPHGVRLSPGTTTLLGSSGDDHLSIVRRFTTLVGGEGRDVLAGSNEAGRIDKLYGGKDDDRFLWSSGFNIVHGGQPELDYASDGTDIVSYAGAGTVRIDANPHSAPHSRPDYIVTTERGVDHLYSIERIAWNGASDRVVAGRGVRLIERQAKAEGAGHDAPEADLAEAMLVTDPVRHRDDVAHVLERYAELVQQALQEGLELLGGHDNAGNAVGLHASDVAGMDGILPPNF